MNGEFVIYLKDYKEYSLEFDAERNCLWFHIGPNCISVDPKKALWDLLNLLAKNGENQVTEVYGMRGTFD